MVKESHWKVYGREDLNPKYRTKEGFGEEVLICQDDCGFSGDIRIQKLESELDDSDIVCAVKSGSSGVIYSNLESHCVEEIIGFARTLDRSNPNDYDSLVERLNQEILENP